MKILQLSKLSAVTMVLAFLYILIIMSAQAGMEQNNFSCESVNEIPISECDALIELYQNMNGPNWRNKRGWLVSDTPCSWHGVTCEDDRISKISLATTAESYYYYNRNFVGDIPPSIGSLNALKVLEFAGGQINSLPEEIGQLSQLELLDIGNSQISTLPSGIGGLSSLNRLILTKNNLTELPSTIGELSDLTILEIERNQLNTIPVTIGNLSNLVKLNLNNNQLSVLPTKIGSLTKLEELYLKQNQLSTLPAEIGALSRLQKLNLKENLLGELPTEISGLSNLANLYLDSNRLEKLPAEIGELSNLATLTLYRNQLQTLPHEIGNLTKLITLHLHQNQLVTLPASIVNLTKLTSLNIANNPLDFTDENLLAWVQTNDTNWSIIRTSTDMFDCRSVTEIPLLECEALVALYKNMDGPYWISGNNWLDTNMPCSWGGVTCENGHVTGFSEGGYQAYYIRGIDPGYTWSPTNTIPIEIGNLSHLVNLEIRYTNINTVPVEIGNLSKLENLDLSGNKIAELPLEIGNLTNLTTLELYNNQLNSLPTDFVNLTNITSLSLAQNRLTVIDKALRTWMNTHDPDWANTQILDTPTPTSTNTSAPTFTSTSTSTWVPVPPISTRTPMPTDTPINTPLATNMPTHTPPPSIPTHPPTPTQSTSTPIPELDNSDNCNQATLIASNTILPESQFEAPLDIDWYTFQATAGTPYRITADIPSGSKADVSLELYPSCGPGPSANWNKSFAPGVVLDFTPPNNGPIYLRLVNADDSVGGPEWRYQLSIRQLNQESRTGAVIIVAGRLKLHDDLQDNIYTVTDRAFTIFRQQGYTTDDIYYLAPEADEVLHHDAAATVDNVGWAITNWAAERLLEEDIPDVLTLYMMDHGGIDELYLDGPRDEILRPTELDGWLDTLEQKVPGVLINVIIEACHAGSFIQEPGSIIGPNRVVVTSSDQENDAYASQRGATFSDQFLTSLQRSDNLFSSWSRATDVVADVHTSFPQKPWINGDGDDVPNEREDFAAASERGFAYPGTLDDSESSTLWPPYIAQVLEPDQGEEKGITISAEVRDDRGVGHVWAIIYPPSYVPPTRDSEDELFDGEDENLERIVLDDKGDDIYRGRAYNFTEDGTYRIVVHADDADGLIARPVVLEYNLSEVFGTARELVYLPFISR